MSVADRRRDTLRQQADLLRAEDSVGEEQPTATVLKKAACHYTSSVAEHQARKLRSAQMIVMRSILRELRDSSAQEDSTDCLSPTGRPWRWHLVAGYIIDYRSLTKMDKITRCPHGGYLINQIVKATPEMLAYMRSKPGVARRRKW